MTTTFKLSKTLAIDPSIQQSNVFDPPGSFVEVKLQDVLGENGANLLLPFNTVQEGFFRWLRVKSHGTYQVDSHADAKYILSVLLKHLVDDPTNQTPQIGTLIKTTVKYIHDPIPTPDAIMPPGAAPAAHGTGSMSMASNKKQRTGD